MRRRKRSKLRNILEYVAARGTLEVIGLLPQGLVTFFGRNILGPLAYRVVPRARKRGQNNLQNAYGNELAAYARGELLRAVFCHIAQTVVELSHYPRWISNGCSRLHVNPNDLPIYEKLQKQGGNIIFVTAHLGNWELGGALARSMGPIMHSVARPLDNPYLDTWVRQLREALGQTVHSKKGSLWALVNALRRGESVGYLVDQDAGPNGVFVDFFGRVASTTRAPAYLAYRTGALIVPGCVVRIGSGYEFEVRLGKPICPQRDHPREVEIHRMTHAFTKVLETWIREFPDQWLWMHRRWKTRPIGEQQVPTTH